MDIDEGVIAGVCIIIVICVLSIIFYVAHVVKEHTNPDTSPPYSAVIVYNADMTEVLYSNADGCEMKEIDGKLVVICGKDE